MLSSGENSPHEIKKLRSHHLLAKPSSDIHNRLKDVHESHQPDLMG